MFTRRRGISAADIPTWPHRRLYSPRDLLKLGSSRPWREVLQEVTGESNISTKAFLTYFKPLMDWLVTENVKQGDTLGWPDFSCSFEGWTNPGLSSNADLGPALSFSGSILSSSQFVVWLEPDSRVE